LLLNHPEATKASIHFLLRQRSISSQTQSPIGTNSHTGVVMSFPSHRDVDALKNFEDDEFDALLSGTNCKFTPSKSPATPSGSAAQSTSTKTTSARTRSSTVAVTDPSQHAPSIAQSSSRAAASVADGQGGAAAPAPLTFGSTAFLSELQNRRKHVLHDNSLKAGASDDDSDASRSAADKQPCTASASVPKPLGAQIAAPSQVPAPKVAETQAAQPFAMSQILPVAADRQSDMSVPDASACLRRLDRLPSTVEKCMKE
jgi:hypothetical protein